MTKMTKIFILNTLSLGDNILKVKEFDVSNFLEINEGNHEK